MLSPKSFTGAKGFIASVVDKAYIQVKLFPGSQLFPLLSIPSQRLFVDNFRNPQFLRARRQKTKVSSCFRTSRVTNMYKRVVRKYHSVVSDGSQTRYHSQFYVYVVAKYKIETLHVRQTRIRRSSPDPRKGFIVWYSITSHLGRVAR